MRRGHATPKHLTSTQQFRRQLFVVVLGINHVVYSLVVSVARPSISISAIEKEAGLLT